MINHGINDDLSLSLAEEYMSVKALDEAMLHRDLSADRVRLWDTEAHDEKTAAALMSLSEKVPLNELSPT